MEFRGHDHIIEVAVFAPAVAYPAIRELAGLPVRAHLSMMFRQFPDYIPGKRQGDQTCLVHRDRFQGQNDKTLGLSDRTDAKKSGSSPPSPHSSWLERISFCRLATITGSELLSFIHQANSSSLLVTITLSVCGNCPQVDV